MKGGGKASFRDKGGRMLFLGPIRTDGTGGTGGTDGTGGTGGMDDSPIFPSFPCAMNFFE